MIQEEDFYYSQMYSSGLSVLIFAVSGIVFSRWSSRLEHLMQCLCKFLWFRNKAICKAYVAYFNESVITLNRDTAFWSPSTQRTTLKTSVHNMKYYFYDNDKMKVNVVWHASRKYLAYWKGKNGILNENLLFLCFCLLPVSVFQSFHENANMMECCQCRYFSG